MNRVVLFALVSRIRGMLASLEWRPACCMAWHGGRVGEMRGDGRVASVCGDGRGEISLISRIE